MAGRESHRSAEVHSVRHQYETVVPESALVESKDAGPVIHPPCLVPTQQQEESLYDAAT